MLSSAASRFMKRSSRDVLFSSCCLSFFVAYGLRWMVFSPWHTLQWKQEGQRNEVKLTTSGPKAVTETPKMGSPSDPNSRLFSDRSDVKNLNRNSSEVNEVWLDVSRLQNFLKPILNEQGKWIQVAGHWIWKDALMQEWNLGPVVGVCLFVATKQFSRNHSGILKYGYQRFGGVPTNHDCKASNSTIVHILVVSWF